MTPTPRARSDRWPRLRRRLQTFLQTFLQTWRSKLVLLLVAFAIVPLAAQACWDYLATRRAFETAALESMSGIAHAKAQALEQLARDRRTQVERIAVMLAPRVRVLLAARESGALPPSRVPGKMPALRDAEELPTSGPAAPSAA